MNHCVPDFEMDDDYSIPTSSTGLSRPRKSSMPEDGIMELLWQNGPVVMPSQNQKSVKRSSPSKYDAVLPGEQSAPREIRSPAGLQEQSASHHNHQQHLFMQEDEMASWLHYPLNDAAFDQDFCTDLLYPAPSVTTATTPVRTIQEFRTPATAVSSLPPIPPARRAEAETETKVQNFAYFSRHKARLEPGPPVSKIVVRESTVVDSSDTLPLGPDSKVSEALGPESRVSETMMPGGNDRSGAMAVAGKEMMNCEITVTSSPGCSSASAEPAQKPPADDRKRKGIEADYAECHSEDVELESSDAKKLVHGSTSAKRSRAAEVHNLSERRRRDRINEKMRALQELIPRCNKSDKASMLDEAIEYLKSLQLQVQMMSMGCGMVPMMFPGVQQYMPPMGMGIGMGMGLDMGRPMMPFPNVLAGSALPTPAAAAHMGPRFPIPAFHMPPVPAPDPSRIQATNQSDPKLNSISMQNPDQPRVPNFADPYQQYLGFHPMHLLPPPQNQSMAQPSSSKSSTSREAENPENHQSG